MLPTDVCAYAMLTWQAEYVSLKLQHAALERLQACRQNGELIALNASLAREWGHGTQLAGVQRKLSNLLQKHGELGPDDEAEGVKLLKKRHIER